MKKRAHALTRRSVLASAAAAPLVLGAGQSARAGGFPDPSPHVPTAAIRTYDDMIKELHRIAHSSKRVRIATLRELGISPGVSEAGRDLWVATVGDGPEHVWLQGRIHGNEPYGADTLLTLLKAVGSSGAPQHRAIREALTLHVIPIYNPDGSDRNLRHTILQDGSERAIDLNRDWAPDAFVAAESRAWYTYWAQVKPAYGLDIHHQGLKTDADGDAVTMSLGISLAPSGPTLPAIKDGLYDRQTRQMQGTVYDAVARAGFANVDRYSVSGTFEIDIAGGVASAVMLGLNWNNLNPERHSHPMVFFETSGNTSEGSIGQKARGKFIKQNVIGAGALLDGIASGSLLGSDRMVWHSIPHVAYTGYLSDRGEVITPWPTYPPL